MRAKRATFTFSVDKSSSKLSKIWRLFENTKFAVKQCYQTCQKLVENAQIEKLKGDTLGDFWTLLASRKKERLDMVFQIFIKDETFSYSIHHFRTLRRAPLTLSNVTLIKEPFKFGLIMQSNLKRNAFSMVLHKRCQSDGV